MIALIDFLDPKRERSMTTLIDPGREMESAAPSASR